MQLNQNPTQHLCIASVPTPNGGLHLGHIGGPYLRMDILSRFLSVLGDEVKFVSGTDPFDSYVDYRAFQQKTSPQELANHYYEQIKHDLATMHIDLDLFFNPLSSMDYKDYLDEMYEQLSNRHAIEQYSENIYVDQNQNEVAGAWLIGDCANCGSAIQGYFCESCGYQFSPENTLNPCHIQQRTTQQVKTTNAFMRMPGQFNLNDTGLDPDLTEKVTAYYRNNPLLRVTNKLQWGTHVLDTPMKYFNYGTSFWYFNLLSELVYSKSAFIKAHGIKTYLGFGFDNIIPFLGSAYATTTQLPSHKPFDAYLCNQFYLLEGEKFSTSRNHAIWAKDLKDQDSLSIDSLRLYLASISVSHEQGNFNSVKANEFIRQIKHFLSDKLSSINEETITPSLSMAQPLLRHFDKLMHDYQGFLNPKNYRPEKAIHCILSWLQKTVTTAQESYWWWKAFSVLAYPFMPSTCRLIWHKLGMEHQPNLVTFEHCNKVTLNHLISIVPQQEPIS